MATVNGTNILVVEDDPAVARALQDGLARDGYSVTWKNNGAEGTAYARDHHPHLIILDVRLPDGSGMDLCRQMRQWGLRQPILILTRQLVFQRFHRGRNATAYPGSGLGLAIVKAIVEQQGGHVTAKSLAIGTRFTLRWPAGRRP